MSVVLSSLHSKVKDLCWNGSLPTFGDVSHLPPAISPKLDTPRSIGVAPCHSQLSCDPRHCNELRPSVSTHASLEMKKPGAQRARYPHHASWASLPCTPSEKGFRQIRPLSEHTTGLWRDYFEALFHTGMVYIFDIYRTELKCMAAW